MLYNWKKSYKLEANLNWASSIFGFLLLFLFSSVGWAPHVLFHMMGESDSPSQRGSQTPHATRLDEFTLQMTEMESGTRYVNVWVLISIMLCPSLTKWMVCLETFGSVVSRYASNRHHSRLQFPLVELRINILQSSNLELIAWPIQSFNSY